MKWLCDTNIISEAMKLKGNPKVINWLGERTQIYLSVISVEEVFWGLAYKQARRQTAWFEKFIEMKCKVLPINEKIARKTGIMRGEFRHQGIIRSQADLLIASTAAEYDLILATRNEKDFEQCGILIFNPFTMV